MGVSCASCGCPNGVLWQGSATGGNREGAASVKAASVPTEVQTEDTLSVSRSLGARRLLALLQAGVGLLLKDLAKAKFRSNASGGRSVCPERCCRERGVSRAALGGESFFEFVDHPGGLRGWRDGRNTHRRTYERDAADDGSRWLQFGRMGYAIRWLSLNQ